ncbi:hypothetical protein [Tardiphaga alba]|uniref:hypothetical protein n=1 Tax=Tardiphaga alba TaxID=340268 RepID=UPI001BAD7EAA|nr:hypothetical protein [Tardiphaga alba]
MILYKTQSLIVDDLKPEPKAEKNRDLVLEEDGDICTPKSEPPNEDDQPLE